MSAFKTVVSEALRGAFRGGTGWGWRRDGRGWRGTWLLAIALHLPHGLAVLLREPARVRVDTRRRRDFYSR